MDSVRKEPLLILERLKQHSTRSRHAAPGSARLWRAPAISPVRIIALGYEGEISLSDPNQAGCQRFCQRV